MLHNTVRAATRGAREHRCICPLALALALAEIDRGVLKAEQPPGAWGGMYAGMSAADRKKVMGNA